MPLITVTFSSQDSRLASKATIAAEVNRLSATFLKQRSEGDGDHRPARRARGLVRWR